MLARPAAALLCFLGVLGAGCLPTQGTIALDHPEFPTGVAVTADGAHLIVVSSDFELAVDDGALLSADLAPARAATPSAAHPIPVVASDYKSSVIIAPLGDRPVLSPNGDRVYVPTRGDNVIAAVDVQADGSLSCGSSATPQRCGVSPAALQLPENDPFTVRMLGEDANNTRVTGFTTLLSSSVITFFSDDKSRAGAARMRIDTQVDLGTDVAGVRSAVLHHDPTGAAEPTVIAGADLSALESLIGARMYLFRQDAPANFFTFDVTGTTGALSMRDMVLVPGSDGLEEDAMITILQPVASTLSGACCDAIARFEIRDSSSLPELHLSGLQSTCKSPEQLSYMKQIDRVLLTCRDDDTIEALDPRTLIPTDVLRFAGRGPYGLATFEGPAAAAGGAPVEEAYVSFFEDNSVGLLSFDANQKLTMKARIGAQSEKPEDGRE
ncbi:MAG TPA: hypothetical protein VGO62_20510 [Myxococcota bacterium]